VGSYCNPDLGHADLFADGFAALEAILNVEADGVFDEGAGFSFAAAFGVAAGERWADRDVSPVLVALGDYRELKCSHGRPHRGL
jgi:hypothetical protein